MYSILLLYSCYIQKDNIRVIAVLRPPATANALDVVTTTSWTEICISVQTYRAYSPVLAKMKMFVIFMSKHIEHIHRCSSLYAVYFCPSISSMFAVYSCAPLLLQCTPMYLMLLLYTCYSQNGNVRDLIIRVLYLVYRYPRLVKLRTSLCLSFLPAFTSGAKSGLRNFLV